MAKYDYGLFENYKVHIISIEESKNKSRGIKWHYSQKTSLDMQNALLSFQARVIL